MTTLETYLKNIYFDPSHEAFFAGARKLMNIVKKQGYNPTFKFIEEFINDQETYSLYKPARKKFKTTRVITKGVRHMYDADLADMIELVDYNQGYNHLLVVIDNFSKRLAVRPLKTKTAKEVKEAFISIFEEMKPPELLRTDAGKEFDNRTLKSYLKDNKIRYQVAYNLGKANFAERCIKNLKGKIWRYITENNTKTYIDVLQKLVKGYNNSVHTTTGKKPKAINKKNSASLWWSVYKPKTKRKLKPYKYRVNDQVRLSYKKKTFSRDFDQNWTTEVFTIASRYRMNGTPVYKVKDFKDEVIRGLFFTEELQKVHISSDKLWKVEKVLKKRKYKGKTLYLVRWLNFGPAADSWTDNLEDV